MTTAYNNKKLIQKGFTLIELLIVIVIIGILSGVAISVINPTAQQNRAKDAVTLASMNKIALATESYVSAYGSIPVGSAFLAGLKAAVASSSSTCVAGTIPCGFSLTNSPLPSVCASATSYYGASSYSCKFYYSGTAGTENFTIYAKSFGNPGIFVYDSTLGKIRICDNTTPPAVPANCVDL